MTPDEFLEQRFCQGFCRTTVSCREPLMAVVVLRNPAQLLSWLRIASDQLMSFSIFLTTARLADYTFACSAQLGCTALLAPCGKQLL
jgi:hypothetical protein